MSEARFRQLERALIRQGVAARHARRAALEIQAHYEQLRLDACARGASSEQAARAAHQAMGADTLLIERYAGHRELRGCLYRWPALYAFAPLASFAVLCAVLLGLQVVTLEGLQHALFRFTVPAPVAMAVNGTVSVALLWVLPVAVAAGFARLASERPVAPRWLIVGVLLVCLTARLMNVGLMLPTPGHRGSASLGIGLMLSALPGQLTLALISSAFALVPYALFRSRSVSRRSLMT